MRSSAFPKMSEADIARGAEPEEAHIHGHFLENASPPPYFRHQVNKILMREKSISWARWACYRVNAKLSRHHWPRCLGHAFTVWGFSFFFIKLSRARPEYRRLSPRHDYALLTTLMFSMPARQYQHSHISEYSMRSPDARPNFAAAIVGAHYRAATIAAAAHDIFTSRLFRFHARFQSRTAARLSTRFRRTQHWPCAAYFQLLPALLTLAPSRHFSRPQAP